MRIGLSAFLALALSACATAAGPLPPAFDGAWDLTPAACADPDGVTRLSISDARLQFHERGADVRSIRPAGEGSVSVDVDEWSIDDTDANERPIIRRRTGRLTLSPDRSGLTVAIGGDDSRYVRCSKV